MIVEFRDAQGSMRTKNTASIDPIAKIVRLRFHAEPNNKYAETIHFKGNADRIDECHNHDNLTSVTETVIEFSESSSRGLSGIFSF